MDVDKDQFLLMVVVVVVVVMVQKSSWTGMATKYAFSTFSWWLRVDQLQIPDEQLS